LGQVESPNPKATGQFWADWGARTASSFVVPNFLREMDRMQDPKVYTKDGLAGTVAAAIPWLRREGKPALNGLGEPIERAVSERFTHPQNPDPVWAELARHEVAVLPTSLEWRGRKLTSDELYSVVELSGTQIRRRIGSTMAVNRNSTPQRRAERYEKIVREEHDRAKRKVMFGKSPVVHP
jgi:hypothetical protein